MRRRLKLYSWLYILGWLILVPVLMSVLIGGFVRFDGGPKTSALEPPREQIARLLPPAPARPAPGGPMLPSPETQLVEVPARFLAPGARPQLIVSLPRLRPSRKAGRRTLRSNARPIAPGVDSSFAALPLPEDAGGPTSLRSTPGETPQTHAPTPPASVRGDQTRPTPGKSESTPGQAGKPEKAPPSGKPKPTTKPGKPAAPGPGTAPPAGQSRPDHAQGGGTGRPDHAQRGGRGKPEDPGQNGRGPR